MAEHLSVIFGGRKDLPMTVSDYKIGGGVQTGRGLFSLEVKSGAHLLGNVWHAQPKPKECARRMFKPLGKRPGTKQGAYYKGI